MGSGRLRERGVAGLLVDAAMVSFGVALLSFGVGLLSVGCGGRAPGGDPVAERRGSPPGVVLIVVDALRADHVGAYGSSMGLTPTLDELAAGGHVFENAMAPSSWTRSTVASLLTSRYPSSIGVLGRDDAIAPEVTTLAGVLRSRAGFQTLGVTTNNNAGRPYGFHRGFDRFELSDLRSGYPDDYLIRTAEGVTRKALRFLDARAEDRPFFLFLHYVDPHDPYLPHPGLLPGPEPPGRFDGSRPQLAAMDRTPAAELQPADHERIRHLYAGEVRYVDLWIGELLRGLEERGLRDEVALVVTADHGESFWERGYRGHGRDLYEEMVHVPLIVRLPASLERGGVQRIARPVSLVDVAPTLLVAAGVEPPGVFEGVDLLPLTRGRSPPEALDHVYAELDLDGRSLEAVRRGDLKLIRDRRRAERARRDGRTGVGALELYDLAADPGERDDLVSRRLDARGRLVDALENMAAAILARAVASERVAPSELDEETLESLRALGYLRGAGPSGEERRRRRRMP